MDAGAPERSRVGPPQKARKVPPGEPRRQLGGPNGATGNQLSTRRMLLLPTQEPPGSRVYKPARLEMLGCFEKSGSPKLLDTEVERGAVGGRVGASTLARTACALNSQRRAVRLRDSSCVCCVYVCVCVWVTPHPRGSRHPHTPLPTSPRRSGGSGNRERKAERRSLGGK